MKYLFAASIYLLVIGGCALMVASYVAPQSAFVTLMMR